MFIHETSISQLSSYELHMRARELRSQAAAALIRAAAREFTRWLGLLVHEAAKLPRRLAAEWERQRAIRALQQFDDRTLADIGLGRGDIEGVVRLGRRRHANGTSAPRRAPSRPPAQRRAA